MSSESRELHIAAGMSSLAAIAEFVADCCQTWHVERKHTFRIQLAVDEAATNIIEHAYQNEGGFLTLRCWAEGRDLYILLHDWGEPFDPTQVPTPNLAEDLGERAVGGLGLYFMHKVMDDLRFTFDALGNHLLMIKRDILP